MENLENIQKRWNLRKRKAKTIVEKETPVKKKKKVINGRKSKKVLKKKKGRKNVQQFVDIPDSTPVSFISAAKKSTNGHKRGSRSTSTKKNSKIARRSPSEVPISRESTPLPSTSRKS